MRDAFESLTRGRPNLTPWVLSLESVAVMRSDRRTFSCLPMVAMIDTTASLKIPVESRYCCVKLCHATPTAIEPKTEVGATVKRCQLCGIWRPRRESNPQPSDPKSDALSN